MEKSQRIVILKEVIGMASLTYTFNDLTEMENRLLIQASIGIAIPNK